MLLIAVSTVFAVPLAAQDSQRSLDLTIGGVGLSIGDSRQVKGLRLNYRDSRLERVDGINLTIWRPYDGGHGDINGIAIGLPLTGGRNITGIATGIGVEVTDAFSGIGVTWLGMGAGNSLSGIAVGGLGVGAGNSVKGLAIGGLGVGAGGDIEGVAIGGFGAGVGGSVRGILIGGLGAGIGSDFNGIGIGGLGMGIGGRIEGVAIGGLGVGSGLGGSGAVIGGLGAGPGRHDQFGRIVGDDAGEATHVQRRYAGRRRADAILAAAAAQPQFGALTTRLVNGVAQIVCRCRAQEIGHRQKRGRSGNGTSPA
jgi:hypothetical protein